MSEADLALAALLPGLAMQAVLIFARLGAAVMVLPGLGEAEVPATLRLGLGLALVFALLPVVLPALPEPPADPAGLIRLVVLEVAAGLWLGGLARLAVLALATAGQAIAALVGLTALLVPDAVIGGQATALGRAFGLVAALLVLATGLHGVALRALAESYAVLPAGAPFPAGAAAEAWAEAGAASLALALRLAAPFVIGAVILNVALGLLSRLAPQVQAFFIAVPGQLLAGIGLLALLAPPLLDAFAEAVAEAFAALPGAR